MYGYTNEEVEKYFTWRFKKSKPLLFKLCRNELKLVIKPKSKYTGVYHNDCRCLYFIKDKFIMRLNGAKEYVQHREPEWKKEDV